MRQHLGFEVAKFDRAVPKAASDRIDGLSDVGWDHLTSIATDELEAKTQPFFPAQGSL